MTQLAIVREPDLSIRFTPEALALKEAALESAALVGRVTNAEEQAVAVEAQKKIVGTLKLFEDSRVAVKAPILEFGRKLDAQVKSESAELVAERDRIGKLCDDFQALELAKARAAQAAENERLLSLERERSAALAQSKTLAEHDTIRDDFAARARDERIVAEPVRADGQIVKPDFDFEVIDAWLLARTHPNCVDIEPKRSEIKSMLRMGIKVAGVQAWEVIKTSVRAEKPKEIAV